MHGHLDSGEFVILRRLCVGSTNKGLGVAATAQVFGEGLAGAAGWRRPDDCRTARTNPIVRHRSGPI